MKSRSVLRRSLIISVLLVALLSISPWQATAGHGGYLGIHLVDPVWTDAGYVAGTMAGDIGKEVRIYRGIPYAAPPVGNLRWRPPQPVTPWKGILECTKFSLWAPQSFPGSPLFGGIDEKDMGEDCLYLNVQTPAKKTNDRLPVMVWFHGGGLSTSSGNFSSYNMPPLPQHGVVSVTVSHRLGAIGYMAHPELTAESSKGSSGNYGQLDLIAALKWVKRNIGAFGGDPHNVTIWGQSGGGGKVMGLLASPLVKGLFHRAICEAGFALTGTPLSAAELYGMSLQEKLKLNGFKADTIADMRQLSWQDIIKTSLETSSGYRDGFAVDGWFLTDTIGNTIKANKHNDVPFMVGAGGGEIRSTNPAQAQFLLEMSKIQKSPIYPYVFTHLPKGWNVPGFYAYHGLEVAYQFGTIEKIYYHYGYLFSLSTLPPGFSRDPDIDWKDEWVAGATMDMWTNFAKYGNPSVRGLIWVPAFREGCDKYLDIGYPVIVNSGYSTLAGPVPAR